MPGESQFLAGTTGTRASVRDLQLFSDKLQINAIHYGTVFDLWDYARYTFRMRVTPCPWLICLIHISLVLVPNVEGSATPWRPAFPHLVKITRIPASLWAVRLFSQRHCFSAPVYKGLQVEATL